ncbi:MAG: universal stress protein [Polyangiaceae bacterium]|nr:universal stress protein [Polyangiaceae bacterium]
MATKLSKILVAVDFSECSMRALEKASELALACGASVDILHVWEMPSFLPPTTLVGPDLEMQQPLLELVREHAANELARFGADAAAKGLKVGAARSAEGDPWRTIVSTAEHDHYDLIALGTMGRTGLMHVMLGSVAEKVVRHSSVPVLTVRMAEAAVK